MNLTRKRLELSFSGKKNLTSCILTYCEAELAFKHATEWSVVCMVEWRFKRMKDTKTVVKWERKFVQYATIRACEAVFVMKLSKP